MNVKLCASLFLAAGVGALVLTASSPAHALAAAPQSGKVSIHKMGGDIDVPDAPDGVDADTMGGNIHIGHAAQFVHAKTMGGAVDVDHADGSADLSTMGGAITVRQVSGPVHAGTMAGDVTVHLTGASGQQRDIHLSSLAGVIQLTVPKDFGMDVKIKLEYTKNSSQNYRVNQHLGLTERQTTDWDTSRGTPRKYIYVTGRVGDGRNHVTIDTINGDVILKQE